MILLTINSLSQLNQDADGIELRLDRFEKIDCAEIGKLLQQLSVPCVITLRKKSQGGSFSGSEAERLALMEELLQFKPDYIDLEYDTSPMFLQKVALKTKLILSYHDFEQTPELEPLLVSMRKTPAYVYKIACKARSPLDALRMCAFVKAQREVRLVGICMGPEGELTRILGPMMGNFFSYAGAENSPEGQLTLQTLHEIYDVRRLKPSSKIYALIGDPVDKSPSHQTHNRFFMRNGIDAVYVKIPLKANELAAFFSYARTLPLAGVSVTMPHKEAVIPYLDKLTPEAAVMRAVNTIAWQDGELCGYNTDGVGALEALEAKISVQGKSLVILGAGATARAIACEAKKRGARVVIVNRTEKKARVVAEWLDCEAHPWEKLPELDYEILINATPVSPEMEIKAHAVAMDVVSFPQMTRFLQAAEQQNCHLVFGLEMFLRQAEGQFRIWGLSQKCPLDYGANYASTFDSTPLSAFGRLRHR